MRKIALIIIGGVVLVWAVLALVLDSPSLKLASEPSAPKRTARAAVSPACLPATFLQSAEVPGTGIDVSPAPGSATANPHTQISFLGGPAAQIHVTSVLGTLSGPHSGRMLGYSQGDGASFIPDRPFDPGEQVSVRAAAGTRTLLFRFRVDTPYPTAGAEEFPNPAASLSDYQTFYTMPGAEAPVLNVTLADRDPGAGLIMTTNGPGPGQYGPLIYTPAGRLVWFERLTGGETAEDLSEQEFEGHRDLTWWKGHVLSLGFGQGEDMVMDSSYRTVARITGGNGLHADLHEFQIAPRDVAYITAYNPIRCDLAPLKGSPGGSIIDTAIQEIDIKTGLVRWEWHSLDHVAASESETEASTTTTPWDWFHLNSIDPQPDGDLFISARSTWAGYELQSGTGRVLWRLGGLKSSFKMGPGTETAWQHDGRILPDGEITFFDDGSNPPIHHQSRALRIRLDFNRHEAVLESSLTHPDPPLLAPSQGNMQTLPDGNTVVGYGGVPQVSEFAPDGSLLFDAHMPYDLIFYRAYRFPWSAQPQSPPAVLSSLNNTAEETIVHASWNGATDVASWRVLAGGSTGALSAKATIPAEGFESSTTLPAKYERVAVQALDGSGRTLGTSATGQVVSYGASLKSQAG
jgi:hypothetical protein